jgi:hypothetical protein
MKEAEIRRRMWRGWGRRRRRRKRWGFRVAVSQALVMT